VRVHLSRARPGVRTIARHATVSCYEIPLFSRRNAGAVRYIRNTRTEWGCLERKEPRMRMHAQDLVGSCRPAVSSGYVMIAFGVASGLVVGLDNTE
jgi:hypothetical protein